MRPNSTRGLGTEHEKRIVDLYDGRHSPSSGANAFDRGDLSYTVEVGKEAQVWCHGQCEDCLAEPELVYGRFDYLGECKMTEKQSITLKKETWEKIAEEAREKGVRPSMFIRFRDGNGKHVDLVVRDVNDDVEMLT